MLELLISPKTLTYADNDTLDAFLSQPPSSRRHSTTNHVFVIVNPTSYTLDHDSTTDEIQEETTINLDSDETLSALQIGEREERLTRQERKEMRARIRQMGL